MVRGPEEADVESPVSSPLILFLCPNSSEITIHAPLTPDPSNRHRLPKSMRNRTLSGWLFPIMWLVVSKPTQFAAVWKLIASSVIEESEGGQTLLPSSMPLFAYCAHLSLGDAWNRVFFGTKSMLRGLRVILAFRAVLWLSACLFYREDSIAGLLLLPTCVWVTVAAALNWTTHILNSEKRG